MKSLSFVISITLAVIAAAIAIGIGITSHHAMAGLENQLASVTTRNHRMQDQLSAINAQSSGAHRDLVTCADIQLIEGYIDGIVAAQGAIGPVEFTSPSGNGLVISALPLPTHCVNE